MPIDVHAHYVPPQLIAAIDARGADVGVRLVRSEGATPALHFDYGFKVRPFFPRLIEPVAQRHAWLDQQGIDLQIVGTWPDIFGYGLPPRPASPGTGCSTTRWRNGAPTTRTASPGSLGAADAGRRPPPTSWNAPWRSAPAA